MYHDVLSRGTGVHNNKTDPPQRRATKEVMIEKPSQTQKDSLPQTDAILNQSTRGNTPLGTRQNPIKKGYVLV